MYKYGVVTQGALSANTTQTVLELKPATAVPIKITKVQVGFDGSAAAAGVRVQLIRQSTDGTGAATPPTPQKKDPGDRAAQCTVLHKLSAEGTLDAILDEQYVQPFGGVYLLQYPLDEEWHAIENGNRIAIRIITPSGVSPNFTASFDFEE